MSLRRQRWTAADIPDQSGRVAVVTGANHGIGAATAAALAALGALIGAALVYLVLDGYSTSTFNDASGTQLSFAFRMTAERAALGISLALLLGFFGGLLPALRAAHMPITAAWRRQ